METMRKFIISGFLISVVCFLAAFIPELPSEEVAEDTVLEANDIQEVTVELPVAEEPEDIEQPIEQVYCAPAYTAPVGEAGANFMRDGVIFENDTRYSWYSQNDLPGGGLNELNASGRNVDADGIVRDADGYVAVASCDYAKGDVIQTPFGEGKVYDYCAVPGTVDIYTNF